MATGRLMGRRHYAVLAGRQAPRSSTLTAACLIFIGALGLATALSRIGALAFADADVLLPMGAAAVALMYGAALLTVPSVHTVRAAAIGLVLFELSLPLMTVTSPAPTTTRSLAVLLALPAWVAAYEFARGWFYAHLAIMAATTVLLLAVLSDLPGAGDKFAETAVLVLVLILGALTVRQSSNTMKHRTSELRALALTDALTGALNRRGLAERFEGGFVTSKAVKQQEHLIGVVSIDIDHFKWFNDTYGHAEGDEVLRRVAAALSEAAGPTGLVARTGGEELVALVPGPAARVAAAFCALLAGAGPPTVTASVGIVDAPAAQCEPAGALWQLLDSADRAMYEAKTTGRNRVCRGLLDGSRQVESSVVAAPDRAAVPAPELDTTGSESSLPGWVLAGYAMLCILRGMINSMYGQPAGHSLYFVTLISVAAVGVLAAAMGPIADRFRWVAGVIGTDFVVLLALLSLDEFQGRVIAVTPVLVTGLMVARCFGRLALTIHHVVVVALCLLTTVVAVSAAHLTTVSLNALVMIGAIELVRFVQQRNLRTAAALHRWSVTDPLTGLANRHGLELAFADQSRSKQVTVLALDVDDFKGVNDTYGHAAGDDALVGLARTLLAVTHDDAIVCRTGGDEFLVVALATRPSALASTIKRAAATLPLPLSVSTGSSVAPPHRLLSLWPLVDAADAALIRSKRERHRSRDARERGLDHDVPAVTDRADGSSSSGSTRTVSPSVMVPASSSRAN